MPKYPGGGGFDMQKLMKEAQKLQGEMQRIQEELAEKTVEGTSGGGMVKAVISCGMQLKSVEIQKEVVDPEDVEMLQDLIVAAVNAAIVNAQEMSNQEMAKVTGAPSMPFKF